MGPCHKVHDEYIKRAYDEKASPPEKAEFEEEFIRFCQQTLTEVERRIKRARSRLAASQTDPAEEAVAGPILGSEAQDKMNEISERIEHLLEQTEVLGCEGKVEEAQELMKMVEKLKEDKAAVKRDNLPMHWIQQRAEIGAAQEKQMEVCDVCGAFLIVNDVQQRVDDHLMGKQHVGFGKLKAALDEMLEKRRAERDVEIENEQKSFSRGNNRDGQRSRSPDRDNRRNSFNRSRGSSGRENQSSYRRRDSRDRSPPRRDRHRERRSRSRSRDGERRSSHSSRRESEGHRDRGRNRQSPSSESRRERTRDKE